ncbi:AAA family ATPase [candidate division WOR-3 bacterium]|nr:AAA family ATPase [candidate division WOR-3 bacterium]
MDEILKSLKIWGYEKYSKIILAALVTGEPLLFIGKHGSGKTFMLCQLARALGYETEGAEKEFNAYDASKSVFEDIIGFPDPEMMKKGKIDYIKSPMTLWNKKFILIDELSRANYAMQSKWLEVIKDRSLMGENIPSLKYVFSAMNPLNYPGAYSLDPALADRFSQIVEIDDYFKEEDIIKIVKGNNEKSSLLRENEEFDGRITEKLQSLIKKVKKEYYSLPKKITEMSEKFCSAYYRNAQDVCSEKEYKAVSERRAGMIFRTLKVMFAIDLSEKIKITPKAFRENFRMASEFSWIYPAIEDGNTRNLEKEILEKTIRDLGFIKIEPEKEDSTERILQKFKNSTSGKEAFKSVLTILNKIRLLQEKNVTPCEKDSQLFENVVDVVLNQDADLLNRNLNGMSVDSYRTTGICDNYIDNDDNTAVEIISEIFTREENYASGSIQEKKTA